MEDYRQVQIAQLEEKIAETKHLLEDPEMMTLATEELARLEQEKKQLEESIVANAPEEESLDERNVILEMKGAAGGDEAKNWGEELLRMYTRFAQLQGFKVENLDESVIKISGKNVFGTFKYEAGVNRVQRIPTTEKRGRV